jgi:hypothetical protein
MTEIEQLGTGGLDGLFDASMPSHQRLSPEETRIAVAMFHLGRDAAAVAARLQRPVADILAAKDRLGAQTQAIGEALRLRVDAQRAKAAAAELEAQRRAAEKRAAKAQSMHHEPTRIEPERWPTEDVALTRLQRAGIRTMRGCGRSVGGLARAFRTHPDHIRRICKESAP